MAARSAPVSPSAASMTATFPSATVCPAGTAKRAIQRLLENPLALRLLEGDFGEGDIIQVDAQHGDLVFERVEAAVAV